jgi:hypothetical protein
MHQVHDLVVADVPKLQMVWGSISWGPGNIICFRVGLTQGVACAACVTVFLIGPTCLTIAENKIFCYVFAAEAFLYVHTYWHPWVLY